MVTSESQLSVAVAPARKVASSEALPFPSHSTVMSAGHVMAGAVSSFTVMSWVEVAVSTLLQWSVAVTVNVRVKL